MRLATFETNGRIGCGAVIEDRVVDLTAAGAASDLVDALSIGAGSLRRAVERAAASLPLDAVRLLPPLAGKGRIFWVGANYTTLVSNRDGSTPGGAYPSLFMRSAESLVGHDAAIVRPTASHQFDYEGELVVVIGKAGRHIAEADALGHVGGLTIANDGCLRDYMDHGRNVTAGKNFDASGSMGPWIVTPEALDPAQPLTIETRVNGVRRQHDSTAALRFRIAFLIAYVSRFTRLLVGDAISTGSPMGAGGGPFGANPPRWLVPGDIVEIEVAGIGTLRNHVVDERAA